MQLSLGGVFFWALVVIGAVWAGTALSIQLGGVMRVVALAALFLLILLIFWARGQQPVWGWAALAVGALAVGGWYLSLTPREDRDWAFDVAHNVTAKRDGDLVHLGNLRDFDWQTRDTAIEHWTSTTVDLNALSSVEMLTSVWSSTHIAHLLVSFGFDDGQHIVFSAEIRREKGEAFSEIGGFFRQFELALIGATERDIVRLRSHMRGEKVSLYPVALSPEHRREMFLAYVGLADQLAERPEFYNTISANCTTVVWKLARLLKPGLPLDISLLLSGHLPAYLEKLGVLGGAGTLAEKQAAALLDPQRIDALMAEGQSFSEAIRQK